MRLVLELLSGLIFAFLFSNSPHHAALAAYPYRAPANIDPPEGCTAIVVDPHASVDGGMSTHTNDCHQCDSRISHVPARDWAPGSLRPIYRYRAAYPRFLGEDRGTTYQLQNTDTSFYPWQPSQAHGFIPQVSHTFAYIDGHYAIENEWQVAMGESTCAARLVAKPIFDGGAALLDVQQLSRIALERAKTARQAVEIMGKLAETYGYYGAEWIGPMAEGEGGEVLMITDPTESFTFHILPDSTGKSAIWAAQKIPKGHVAVCANAFFIKEIDFGDPINFLYSANIVSEAKKLGFYDESFGPFHFTHTYGLLTVFEAYSSHRTWRIFSLVAPSLQLQLTNATSIETLPFSVKADRLLSKFDLFQIQRDHYEGTSIDQTVGLQGGPYGNPNRYDRSEYWNTSKALLFQGNFERVISLHRTIYSFVTTSRPYVPNYMAMLWFGSGIPHSTVYVPVYVVPSSPPFPLTVGSLHGFDRRSSFWAATTIAGWLEKCFKLTVVTVAAAQQQLEQHFNEAVVLLEKQVRTITQRKISATGQQTDSFEDDWITAAASTNDRKRRSNPSSSSSSSVAMLSSPTSQISPEQLSLLSDFHSQTGERAVSAWWSLFESIVTQFHDGFRVDDIHVETLAPRPVFYPLFWLNAVGFFDHKPDYNKTTWELVVHPSTLPPHNNNHIAPPTPAAAAAADVASVSEADSTLLATASSSSSPTSSVMSNVIIAAVFLMLGLIGGYKVGKSSQVHSYVPIQHTDA